MERMHFRQGLRVFNTLVTRLDGLIEKVNQGFWQPLNWGTHAYATKGIS